MNPYYEGFVRARRTIDALAMDHTRIDEVVIHTPVRVRVGLSLVNLGNQLIGVPSSVAQSDVRPAA